MDLKQTLLVGILLCGQSSYVSSALSNYNESTQTLLLAQLVNIGLSINPKIQEEEAKVQSAINQIKVEEGGYWPSLSASAGPRNGFYGELSYDVTLRQVLYDWGKVAGKVDSATAKKFKQIQSLLAARSEAALEIIEVCYDLYNAQQKIDAIKAFQIELDKIHTLAKDRANLNFSDTSEFNKILKFQAYINEQSAIANGELRSAEGLYRLLLGRPANSIPDFSEPLNILAQLQNEDVLEEAVLSSPDYIKAEQDILIAQAEVKVAKGALKPDIVFEASAINREISGSLTKDESIGVNVEMNFTQGLSAYYQAQSSEDQVEAARWALQSVRRELYREYNSNSENEIALKQRLDALAAQRVESEEMAETYAYQFTAGLRTIEDLLTSKSDTLQISMQLISASSEYHQLPYRMAAKLGMLNKLLLPNYDEASY